VIVHSPDPIVLVGAGDVSADDIKVARRYGSKVVAADGGASHCVAAGIVPDAVIGDLDSLPGAVREVVPEDRIHRIPEQETTDFDKCLRSVAAPLVLAVGFAGPRLDHMLAAFNALVRRADTPAVVVAPSDLVFHAPPRLALDLAAGERLSLFPLASVSGRSRGLLWPIDGLALAPSRRIGTSNVATGPVVMEFDAPGMLVITPRAALPAVMRGLSG